MVDDGGGERGITNVGKPLREGQLVGLHLQVNAIGRIAGGIERLEDLERDQHDQSLRNGRLLQHGPAAVGGLDRVEDIGSVLGQVAFCKEAAPSVGRRDDRPGDGAAIERRRPLRLDGAQGTSKVRLPEPEPRHRRPPVGKEDRPRIRKVRRDHRHGGVIACLPVGERKPRFGIGDRVPEQGAQRPRAKALDGNLPGVDDAGDTGRQPAVFGNSTEGQVAVDGAVLRGGAAAVDRRHRPGVGRRHQHERVAAQLAAPRLDHGEHRPGRDRRVHGVPPVAQHPETGRARERVDARDHAVRCAPRFLGRPASVHQCAFSQSSTVANRASCSRSTVIAWPERSNQMRCLSVDAMPSMIWGALATSTVRSRRP